MTSQSEWPKTFNSLEELFSFDPPIGRTQQTKLSKAKNAWHDFRIPVCLHNLYHLVPYTVERGAAPGEFVISFPESRIPIVLSLDVEPPFEPRPQNREWRTGSTPEDEEPHKLFSVTFRETLSGRGIRTIDDLMAQLYLCHANSFNWDLWYGQVCGLAVPGSGSGSGSGSPTPAALPAETAPLTEQEVAAISRLHATTGKGRFLTDAASEIAELASSIAPRLAAMTERLGLSGKRFFFKLSTRSAKDSLVFKEQQFLASIVAKAKDKDVERQAEAPLERCQARNAVDVVRALVASRRTADDCRAWLGWMVRGPKPPLQLVVSPFIEFQTKNEVRCFVFEGKLTAINTLAFVNFYPALDDREYRDKIENAVMRLFGVVHGKLPFQTYVLDAIYHPESDSAQLCEINPFGPGSSTGSNLYSWQLDTDILFGKRLEARSGRPDFRYLKRGMQVKEVFDLQVAKDWFTPSASFLERLATVSKQCPCCPRFWSESLPPTQLVHVRGPPGSSPDDGFLKLVIVVRSDAKMTPGKAASQCAHAAISAFRLASSQSPAATAEWLRQGEPTVVLKATSLEEIQRIEGGAKKAGLLACVLSDAGRTQVVDGTVTVISLGPGLKKEIDQITGDLALF